MNHEETKRIRQAWALSAAYYKTQIPDEVILMYVEDVEDLPYALVMKSLVEYRRNPKNRTAPLPAHIREMVLPEPDNEAVARDLAAKIVGAVPKYGWANPDQARAFIGEVGWRVVEKNGGWVFICENLGSALNPSTFQAQCRDLALAVIKYGDKSLQEAQENLLEKQKEKEQLVIGQNQNKLAIVLSDLSKNMDLKHGS